MSESASQRSGDASETSSQAADRAILRRRNRNRDNADGEEDDLLERKKSLQEGVFSAMYMLSRSKSADSWKFAVAKIILEALIPTLVVFNPTNQWDIDTSNPVWQVVRWALPRSPVARIWGYDVYMRVCYAMVALVYVAVFCIALLTIAMRRQEHSKALRRYAGLLQLLTEVVFTLAYMSVFDYMVFLFDCKYTAKGTRTHTYWTHVACFQTPHIIHMAVAGVTSVVFFACTALMLVSICDLNPVARGIMASPTAVLRLRVLALKALFIIVVNVLSWTHKVQAVVMMVAAMAITYFNFVRLPFLRYYINFFWVGGWMAVCYVCGIFCMLQFSPRRSSQDFNRNMVQLVLYGVFPAFALGSGGCALWFRYRMSPSRKFANVDPAIKLKKVYKFASPEDVEVLSRTMRHFDIDGVIHEESALVGETVIKCGLAVFPAQVELLILYANFLMEVKRDGPAARTQLQLALKAGPSLVQRYQIFSTIEDSKRLKDGQEGQLDLQSYVEFKRNYRAVIRMHKAALTAQREYWQLMQRTTVKVSAIQAAMREMGETADTASQVYRRVLERYPNNGKLLRCFGKFLEDVRNDPMSATRAYTEAGRNGGGDGLLSLDLQISGGDKPEFLVSMDLHEDACIVTNAEGMILMVTACVTTLLGYPKTDLEGANVSMIMPQPFSGRHPGYLARYVQGGEPHILDTVRDVVALHKERHVFPLQICVTKLSGVGSDAIFMGLLRPQPLDSRSLRAWVAPNGVILCTDPQFASLTGMLSDEMVGCSFQTLCTDMAEVEALLEICREAPYESLVSGTIVRDLHIVHKHLPPIAVEVKVTPGGTDCQRIFVFNACRSDGNTEGLLVVDTKGALTFATWDVAAMLGYPLKKFLKMRFEQLLPPPFATMHAKYLREQTPSIPPVSCRAGRVVHLVNSNGAQVPVRLHTSTQDDSVTGEVRHIVQIRKLDANSTASYVDKRLVLMATMDGRVVSVEPPESALFGFTASSLLGSNLSDCVDVFSEWREKASAQQELLLLSLLDRELEMPGTSWRVKVYQPLTTESLPAIDPRAPPRQALGRAAVMQTEIVESAKLESEHVDSTGSLVRIILWRRDLLTGVIELDERLVVRKADMNTGLIMGLPPSILQRTSLSRLLDVPKGITWSELTKDKKKKSALKGSTGIGVSPVLAFQGPHPDGGTIRVFLQGVSGVGSSRIYATLHPDTTFTGARANIYRALGLEAITQQAKERASGSGVAPGGGTASRTTPGARGVEARSRSGEPGARTAGGAGGSMQHTAGLGASKRRMEVTTSTTEQMVVKDPGRSTSAVLSGARLEGVLAGGAESSAGAPLGDEDWPDRDSASQRGRSADGSTHTSDDDDEEGGGDNGAIGSDGKMTPRKGDEDAAAAAHLHKAAHNQSEFVTQWVRTLAKQMTGSTPITAANDPAGERDVISPSRSVTRRLSGVPARGPSRVALTLGPQVDEADGGKHAPEGGNDGAAGGGATGGAVAVVASGPQRVLSGAGGSRASGRGAGTRQSARWAVDMLDPSNVHGSRKKLDVGLPRVVEERGGGDGEGAETEEEEDMMALGQEKVENGVMGAAAGDNDASSVGDDDEAASQGLGPNFTDSSSAVDVDMGTDVRRSRLLKRMLKVFTGPQLMEPLLRMRYHTLGLLAVMLLTHVVIYIIFINLINHQFTSIREVHRLALAADRCQLVTVKAVLTEFCARPGIMPMSCCETKLHSTLADLRSALDDLESYHQSTYLGNGGVPRRIKDSTAYLLWTGKAFPYRVYYDTLPPTTSNETTGVWQLGNRFIATGRELLYWGSNLTGRIQDLRAFKFVLYNGPYALFAGYSNTLDYLVEYAWQEVSGVQIGLIVMLVLEAAGVQLVCIWYQWWLVQRVELVRWGALLSGLGLPGPMLRIMASKPTTVVEDSDDDEAEEDEGGGDGGGNGGGGAGGDNQSETQEMQQFFGPAASVASAPAAPAPPRPRYRRMSMDMVPPPPSVYYGMPGAGMLGDPLAPPDAPRAAPPLRGLAGEQSLAGSSMVISGRRGAAGAVRRGRGGRVHVNGKELLPSYRNLIKFMLPLLLWELALIIMGSVSYLRLEGMQGPLASLNMASHVIYRYTRVRASGLLMVTAPDPTMKEFYRTQLRMEVTNLVSEYDTLMYGGLAITQATSVFSRPVPASTFESSSFSSNFFREQRCFRWNQSTCYTPDSPYYEVTHHGLDVMFRRIVAEMELLAADDEADAVYNSTRYTTVFMVGTKDLYEGLQSSAQLFVDFSIDRYNSIKLLHTIMLVVTIVFFFMYGLLLLKPYGNAVHREAVSLAGLLSHVPAEMDVAAHTRQVLRAHAKLHRRSVSRSRRGQPGRRISEAGSSTGSVGSVHGAGGGSPLVGGRAFGGVKV